jgi:uncharacterized OsmC-like protein
LRPDERCTAFSRDLHAQTKSPVAFQMAYLNRGRATRLMREAGLDAVVMFKPENFTYATGLPPGVAAMWRRAGGAIALVSSDASIPVAAIVGDLGADAARAAAGAGVEVHTHMAERATGATAVVERVGHGTVTSATGAALEMSAALSSPGYSPVDLMYAAVAGCLALSARIAASEMKLLDRFVSARASVHGRKAAPPERRVTHLDIRIDIEGDFDDATRHMLIARAEQLCTVSNTLKNAPEFVVNAGS